MSDPHRLQMPALLLATALLGWPAFACADALAIGLQTTLGGSQTGLSDVGQSLTLIPLDAAAENEDDASSMLQSAPPGNNAVAGIATFDYVGGLPGLDGLNASREAFRKALRGLDPTVVRTVLGQTDPAILMHITQSLTAPLPGLSPGDGAPAGLPGLDGLPIHQPR